MTLLDRFRTQSRDKHPDVAVRLAYVAEIPLDDKPAIAAMAREDDDPRVRRAAVAKLMDVAALGTIARDDRDLDVRAQAAAMLRDIALEAFEGGSESESLEAVDAVSDPRTLAQIAKSALREIVALRAVSRLGDAHVLGSVARHAAVEAARRNAFAALTVLGDHSEIIAIAMNGEHKDTALAAVGRISDRDELEQVAARSKNKSAVKRARTLLREADEAVARDAAALAEAERTAAAAAHPAAPAEAQESPAPVVVVDHASIPEPSAEQQLAAAAAVRAAEDEARQQAEQRRARLMELSVVAAAAAGESDLAAARKQMNFLRREWHHLTSTTALDESLADTVAQFTAADARVQAREADAREADLRARRDALVRLQQLAGRVEPLAVRPDLTLKAAERAVRDLRAALGALPALPSKQDVDEVTRRLKAAQTALLPKLQELRDADEWQRFANVTIQEQLCAKMEALKAQDDPDAIATQVREFQQQWRQAADVPRAQADALWRRFKAAHDEVWAKCESYFAAQAQERAANLATKIALCEKAEALADSTNWLQTAEAIKQLQQEWKAIGAVSRGREKAIWERFRSACDRFFTRRHEDLVQRKAAWTDNLARKEALCLKAEGLADSTEWEPAAAELRRLQAEWKSIGPVKKTRSEAIWQRFRGACDKFYQRYAQRHDTAQAERVAAREALCAEAEALADLTGDDPPADLPGTLRALRSRWQQELASRGVDVDRARALDARFTAAVTRVPARWPAAFVGSDLDPDANRKRMESLVTRMEALAASLSGGAADDGAQSPVDRLAARLKEALAANTIGGKADDEARHRSALEEMRQAQASWSRIGVVDNDARRGLADRFQRATRTINNKAGETAKVGGAR